jgi:hypothetical protein
MVVLKEFHNRGKFEKSHNATFVYLISKKAGRLRLRIFSLST